MKVLLFLALSLVTCKAFILSGCSSDKDCGADGCCVPAAFGRGTRCHHRIQPFERCLIGTIHADCGGMCVKGLQCVDETTLDIAVEPGFNTQLYGRCGKPASEAPATNMAASTTAASAVVASTSSN